MIQFLCRRSSRSKAAKKNITKSPESSDTLASLIRKREWQSVSNKLFSSPEECSSENSAYIERCGETLLHMACRNHPTCGIFEKLLIAFSDSITICNRHGQCPLHIAARNGVHPVNLDMLIQKSPIMLKKRDSDGRIPLHLACAFYARNFMNVEDLSAISPTDAATHAIKVLVRSDASVVNVEDQRGCTGLEYAITCNSDIEAIRFLQRYCLRNWRGAHKKRKASGEKKRMSITSLSRITNFMTQEVKDTPETHPYESISTSTHFSCTTSSNLSSLHKQTQDPIQELDECASAYDKKDTVLSSLDIQV